MIVAAKMRLHLHQNMDCRMGGRRIGVWGDHCWDEGWAITKLIRYRTGFLLVLYELVATYIGETPGNI